MKANMNAIQFVETLSNRGWIREMNPDAQLIEVLPVKLPHQIEVLCSQYISLRNIDDTVWFYSKLDYNGVSDSEFEWNFFEKNSLECVVNEIQRASVLNFWEKHIPFCASVIDGYSYIAFRHHDGVIIYGREPEYEDSAKIIANSIEDFFEIFLSSIHGGANKIMNQFLGIGFVAQTAWPSPPSRETLAE
jgi:hypothetical protein